jgi:hypothetical protein
MKKKTLAGSGQVTYIADRGPVSNFFAYYNGKIHCCYGAGTNHHNPPSTKRFTK